MPARNSGYESDDCATACDASDLNCDPTVADTDSVNCDTACGIISDTDTAIQFWDHRMMMFKLVTDEDGAVTPAETDSLLHKFPTKLGYLIVEFHPDESFFLLYGVPRQHDSQWLLRAQVRVFAKSIVNQSNPRVVDTDVFDFGSDKTPIRFNLKCRDVTKVKIDVRYVFEVYGSVSSLDDLDGLLAAQPPLTAKELLEKFYWSQCYKMENLRRASLMRVESSCKHLVKEMLAMPDYQRLNEELRMVIEKRFEDGWTTVKDRLGYCEATSCTTREIVIDGEGKLFGGPDKEAVDETSLATTFGMNSDIMGSSHSMISV